MLKNIVLVLLVVVVLAMGAVFLAPRLGLTLNKKPFDPPAIANEIILEVGASSVSTSLLCSGVQSRLGSVISNMTCQQNRYSATEARDRIDEIVEQYRIKPSGDWGITDAGFTRSFGSPDITPETVGQSVIVMVSSDIVLVSYDE